MEMESSLQEMPRMPFPRDGWAELRSHNHHLFPRSPLVILLATGTSLFYFLIETFSECEHLCCYCCCDHSRFALSLYKGLHNGYSLSILNRIEMGMEK